MHCGLICVTFLLVHLSMYGPKVTRNKFTRNNSKLETGLSLGSKVKQVKVKVHTGQGQIRVSSKGMRAYNNLKLLHFRPVGPTAQLLVYYKM